MNIHKNARLTRHGRELLIQRVVVEGLRPIEVAQASGVSVRTVHKWLKRYREEGLAGLEDRSSRPIVSPRATSAEICEQIITLRRSRKTYRQISQILNISPSTVSRLLRKEGLNRLASLEPIRPVVRYEYELPGGLLHIDIKKLGRFNKPGHRVTGDRHVRSRGTGWEYVHVAIDSNSRLAFSEILSDQTGRSACIFLIKALRYYASLGIRVERVMTDNGGCYKSGKFKRLCQRLGIKHLRTRPYTPQTNGKAERFIQTSLREWAYAHSYDSSEERKEHLPRWLHEYNWHRPHASLKYRPPISRLVSVNNLLALHI